MSYGYTDEVVLPVPITAPAGLAPGTPVTLRGQASWLVCEKICIPEEAPVALTLPVGPAEPDPAGAALIAGARRAVPVPSPWPALATATTPETVTFTVAAPGAEPGAHRRRLVLPDALGRHRPRRGPDGRRHRRTGSRSRRRAARCPTATGASIDGVLVITERLDGGTVRQAFFVQAVTPRGRRGGVAGAAGDPGARLRWAASS